MTLEGTASFAAGSAYQLPLEDDSMDWTACQALLMHLDKPEAALEEMVRVVKPGGLVTCFEPDHLSSALAKPCWSLPELSIEDQLLRQKIVLLSHYGRIKLRYGDWQVAGKIPRVMKHLGPADIGARRNDQVLLLEPPYETELQKTQLRKTTKFWFNEATYK